MSYIYALYFIEQKAVKIGKADDLLNRLSDLVASWGNIDPYRAKAWEIDEQLVIGGEQQLHNKYKKYQKQFIATNAISLAEAYVYTKNGDFVAPLAVYDNDAIIGFVMIAYDKKIGISSGNYLLFRFMIDKNFQNQGYFKPIMDKVLDYVRTAPAGLSNKLWLSYEPENEHARSCYLSYGFKETGEISENEVVAIYDLTIEK